MNRSLGAAWVIALLAGSFASAVAACSSSDDGAAAGPDGGTDDGSSGGGDGAVHPTSGPDGSVGTDGGADGGTSDGSTDASVDAPVDAGPPAVQFTGRFDNTPPDGPKVAWPGATIIANFMGTEVKATFVDTMLFTDYGGDRWQVSIDGAPTSVIQLDHTAPATTYTLATGLTAGAHEVELYKLTEASVGTTQFQGFDFSGGALLPPPLPATRHLQFLGDSASNGYGIEDTDPCSFKAATENERKAYPALLARALNADHHSLGASGKGVYQNYVRPPADTDLFGIIYQLDSVYAGAAPWDYSNYTPDVVWITLGGNDYDQGYPAATDPPTVAQFQGKYDQLVTTVRTQHPAAHIFCSVAPSLTDAYPTGFKAYTNVTTALHGVVNAHNGAGDTKVYYFEFTRSTSADLTACGGHVNAAKHQAMANEAMVLIKAKTGW